MELWKEIKTHPGYSISNTGKVKSPKGNIRKTKLSGGRGDKMYECIRISLKDGGAYIHRLVATAFVPNPNGHKEVNHIDGNKLNNHYSNLEWCTRKYNCIHSRTLNNKQIGLH